MSFKELTTIMSPMVILLAIGFYVASELCQTSQLIQAPIIGSNPDFEPFCYIKTFNLEPPELKLPKPIGGMQNISSIAYSGTAASGTSQYYSFSPSFEAPEES